MFDAWDVSLNGVLIPLLREEWSLSAGEAAWIGTANLIGMALGAFVWGTIADRIGRKKAFAATLLVFSVFTLAGALTGGIGWFVLFRFLAGFGLGGCIPVDYALVGEFTPRRHRGTVLTAMDGATALHWAADRGATDLLAADGSEPDELRRRSHLAGAVSVVVSGVSAAATTRKSDSRISVSSADSLIPYSSRNTRASSAESSEISRSIFPASIFEKSRISSMISSRAKADSRMRSTISIW